MKRLNTKELDILHTTAVLLVGIIVFITSCGAWADSSLIDKAILKASAKHGIKARNLYKIAMVESSLNYSVKPRFNKNGTMDVGVFQINSIHARNKCKMYNIETLQGNANCAALLIAMHKRNSKVDTQWLARYHSKTPSLKASYYEKLLKAERYLESKKIIASID